MAAIDGIKHVVVLMLENRSFDSMLGKLYPKSASFEGLSGNESNPFTDPVTGQAGTPRRVWNDEEMGPATACIPDPDPGELFQADMQVQLYGLGGSPANGPPTMSGFVDNYVRQKPDPSSAKADPTAKKVLGLNVNVVRGYTGAAPLFLAMQRGELDGQMVGLSSVRTGQRDLWTRKAFRPLMAFGRTNRHAEFPDMPTGRELARDPAAVSLIEFAELPFFMALPFAAPPDIPADRAKALQTAFMAMCRDKAFVDEAEKLGVDISPIDGEAILKLLAQTSATPKDVITRYNTVGGEKK